MARKKICRPWSGSENLAAVVNHTSKKARSGEPLHSFASRLGSDRDDILKEGLSEDQFEEFTAAIAP